MDMSWLLFRSIIMPRIPKIVHFCFGFAQDFGGKPFSLVHYLAIKSAVEIIQPDEVRLLYRFEPTGDWWDKAKPLVTLIPIEPPTEIFGNPLLHPAHQSDVVRLRTLQEFGGIYLDIDVISVRPFDNLLNHGVVMGEEVGEGLCNAVVLAEPESEFISRWIAEYRSFRSRGRDEYWGEHSVKLPARLAEENAGEIQVLGPKSFFWPLYWPEHLEIFFRGQGEPAFCDQSYCVHLWEQLTWEPFLRDLTPQQILDSPSEFAKLTKAFL